MMKMIDPELKFISEPKLTFGHGQKAIDPRDGLMLFGPFDGKKVRGEKTIGVIGPLRLQNLMIDYLKKIHKHVVCEDNTVARPNFPGLESAFGVSINFDNIQQLNIEETNINKFLNYSDSHQRVHNLVNLYVDRLNNYMKEEEIAVDMWFVVIPKSIYQYCRPLSKIRNNENTVHEGLRPKERNEGTLFLFDDMQEEHNRLSEAYLFEVNFHNQLKAKLLPLKITTQIIREDKIDYEHVLTSERFIESERKFDSAKAWNISTTMYYKLGGLPWKLGDIREKVCYLGLVYKQLDEKNKNACCAAQMFLDSGDGMVFKGNIGPYWDKKKKEFHLTRNDATSLISQSLNAFQDKFGFYPEEVFIHARTYFNDEEWDGFEEAASNIKLVGVRIREHTNFKMYRQKQYCIPRGTMLQFDYNKAFLWTKGFIPRIQNQMGLETPNPLEIDVVRGTEDIYIVCRDILSLTKLNYNACIYGDGVPVTLKFADSIGEVLTAGRNIVAGVLPFKYYI